VVPQGVTFPIDITKTRLQLQGQADFTGTKFGFGGMAANIAKTEGIAGLYAGVTPAVARHIPYTGFRAIGAHAGRDRASAHPFSLTRRAAELSDGDG
jgi:solute carrier family 25 uncoupling protein 27